MNRIREEKNQTRCVKDDDYDFYDFDRFAQFSCVRSESANAGTSASADIRIKPKAGRSAEE